MEFRCPHCGKVLQLSVAELKASGGVVICPQCVSEFRLSDSDLKAAADAEREQVIAEPAQPTPAAPIDAAFCHHCGKQLPARGLNFCPFCGSPLAFKKKEEKASKPATPSAPAPQPARKPVENEHKTKDDYPFIKPMRIMVHEEPASLRFRLFAYTIIFILIAIFIFLVVKGNME